MNKTSSKKSEVDPPKSTPPQTTTSWEFNPKDAEDHGDWLDDVSIGHDFVSFNEPMDVDDVEEIPHIERTPTSPNAPQTPNFRHPLSTFPDLLRLSTQFSAFSQPSEYAEFFHKLFTHKSMDGLDFSKLVFRWFYEALDLLNANQFIKATAIAKKINKKKITNPLALSLLSSNKQMPPPKSNEEAPPKATIFDFCDDVLSKIYTFLKKKERFEVMKTSRLFAIIGHRPSSLGSHATINMLSLKENRIKIYPGMWKRFSLCKSIAMKGTELEIDIEEFEKAGKYFGNTFSRKRWTKVEVSDFCGFFGRFSQGFISSKSLWLGGDVLFTEEFMDFLKTKPKIEIFKVTKSPNVGRDWFKWKATPTDLLRNVGSIPSLATFEFMLDFLRDNSKTPLFARSPCQNIKHLKYNYGWGDLCHDGLKSLWLKWESGTGALEAKKRAPLLEEFHIDLRRSDFDFTHFLRSGMGLLQGTCKYLKRLHFIFSLKAEANGKTNLLNCLRCVLGDAKQLEECFMDWDVRGRHPRVGIEAWEVSNYALPKLLVINSKNPPLENIKYWQELVTRNTEIECLVLHFMWKTKNSEEDYEAFKERCSPGFDKVVELSGFYRGVILVKFGHPFKKEKIKWKYKDNWNLKLGDCNWEKDVQTILCGKELPKKPAVVMTPHMQVSRSPSPAETWGWGWHGHPHGHGDGDGGWGTWDVGLGN